MPFYRSARIQLQPRNSRRTRSHRMQPRPVRLAQARMMAGSIQVGVGEETAVVVLRPCHFQSLSPQLAGRQDGLRLRKSDAPASPVGLLRAGSGRRVGPCAGAFRCTGEECQGPEIRRSIYPSTASVTVRVTRRRGLCERRLPRCTGRRQFRLACSSKSGLKRRRPPGSPRPAAGGRSVTRAFQLGGILSAGTAVAGAVIVDLLVVDYCRPLNSVSLASLAFRCESFRGFFNWLNAAPAIWVAILALISGAPFSPALGFNVAVRIRG